MSIRNFVIIAHIDHGKSTLADRFLELTGTVEKRKMREQFLDTMELEREKGITIKMQPVRMVWAPNHTKTLNPKPEIINNIKIRNPNDQNARLGFKASDLESADSEQEFVLNLIDTPGHVDFTYEVSRALAAVEGAILLVDGTQGIQAQTIANLILARKEKLVIIPAINKVDLASCRIEDTKEEIKTLLGCRNDDIFLVSGKTGEGVRELLRAVIEKIPAPHGTSEKPLQALIFDSQFDVYKGVIAHIRVFDGRIETGERLKLAKAGGEFEVLEVGTFQPDLLPRRYLAAGEIGYLASGIKEPQQIKVGDTLFRNIDISRYRLQPLHGYQEPRPVVFASVYPEDADQYERFRDALRKLKLNDAALFFEPESSEALGRGFRMGFLGMLHLEITGERLRREYGLPLIFSTPSVSYKITLQNGEEQTLYSAAKFPELVKVIQIQEPWVRLNIVSREKYLGATMKLLEKIRGAYVKTDYLGHGRLEIVYESPLKEIIVDFYDRLKSITEGYGSMSYEILGNRAGNLVKLDILIANERHDEFSTIVPKEKAYEEGKRLTARLKDLLPRQLFPVAIQAAIGGDVIARETLSALKKDVTGYLYGGDRTRKMKLWEKQRRGKKRLKEAGKVEIPPDVFLKMMKK